MAGDRKSDVLAGISATAVICENFIEILRKIFTFLSIT
jgi:hypothetical protein